MKKLYFIVGSQDLYGEECLKQVAEDSRQMVAFLNEKSGRSGRDRTSSNRRDF